MGAVMEEKWFVYVVDGLDAFCKRIDEKVHKQEQQLKASKKNTELEIQLTQEMKINTELKEKLAKLTHQGSELDRICATFDSRLNIADRDQQRLETAKEMYQIAKDLTGVRLDFTAPQTIAKGYVKNSQRKVLQTFEMDHKMAADGALWDLVAAAGAGNENVAPAH